MGQTFQVFFSNNGVYFSPGDSNTNLYCGSTAQSLVGPTSSTIAHFVYTGGTGWNVYFYSVNIDWNCKNIFNEEI